MGKQCRLLGEHGLPRRSGGEGYPRGRQRQEDDDPPTRIRELLVFAGRVVVLRPLARIRAAFPVPMGVAMLREYLRMLMEQMQRIEP